MLYNINTFLCKSLKEYCDMDNLLLLSYIILPLPLLPHAISKTQFNFNAKPTTPMKPSKKSNTRKWRLTFVCFRPFQLIQLYGYHGAY